jgi:hypothetical protein
MSPISYSRHRFPPVIIPRAVRLCLRFTLSYRDLEELFAERGLEVSYQTVRSWVLKFGPMMARRLRQRRPRPSDRWHLDEMFVKPLNLTIPSCDFSTSMPVTLTSPTPLAKYSWRRRRTARLRYPFRYYI